MTWWCLRTQMVALVVISSFVFFQLRLIYNLSCLIYFLYFVLAGKMKDHQALVNETSKKVAAKNRRKNVPSVSHLLVRASPGSTSRPIVDLGRRTVLKRGAPAHKKEEGGGAIPRACHAYQSRPRPL